MSIVKSLSVGNGDMFYIQHNSDNFTIIDCCMPDGYRKSLLNEIAQAKRGKGVTRFISTHPDQDHLCGLCDLDAELELLNFYCVKNKATKPNPITADFLRYCALRDDSSKAFYLYKGCGRKWMNSDDEDRRSSGLNVLWPDVDHPEYKAALEDARNGKCPNNLSIVLTYSLDGGATILWMGDLETAFMENIENSIHLAKAHIVFAPHHGRDTGRIPGTWLKKIKADLIIVGEAPTEHLHYYPEYNTITQNSAGDITFECEAGLTHIYVSNVEYEVDFLEDLGRNHTHGKYIGTLFTD